MSMHIVEERAKIFESFFFSPLHSFDRCRRYIVWLDRLIPS